MHVFNLPSYPYVFKVIKDRFGPTKRSDRATVMRKFELVKDVDRVGRMVDATEFVNLALPRARFALELVEQLLELAPSTVELDGEHVIVRHCYVERRMTPLNVYLGSATSGAGRRRGPRLRQRDPRARDRERLPRRHALPQLRPHPLRPGRLLRLRRDRGPHRLRLPGAARAAGPRGRARGRSRGSASARSTCSPRSGAPSCSAIPSCATRSSPTTPTCSARRSGRTRSGAWGRARSSTSSRIRRPSASGIASASRGFLAMVRNVRVTRTTVARSCAICERSLLMGERVTRFAPHGDDELVDVCPLCTEIALEHGWVKEGSPTTPTLPARRRRRRGGLGRWLEDLRRPALARAGARGADPAPPLRRRARGRRGRRPLQRERLPEDGRRDREEPRRSRGRASSRSRASTPSS